MLYDTHAHVNFNSFKNDYKELITSAIEQGIWLNNVGTQKNTSQQAVKIAQEFPLGVYAVVGLHPIHTVRQVIDEEESHFLAREEKFDRTFYLYLAQEQKVVGIGECGLDYYRLPPQTSIADIKKIQEPVFIEQIKVAKELNKALVIHCRPSKDSTDAYDDILQILRRASPRHFEIHSFTADWQVCRKFLELGGYIGLNGIITFDKTGTLAEVVKNCPLDRIILETDAPYLAPIPFRGKRNEPSYVQYVAQKIAEIKGLDITEVAKITTANARKLFKV